MHLLKCFFCFVLSSLTSRCPYLYGKRSILYRQRIFENKVTNLNNIIAILILCQHANRSQNFIHHFTLCLWIPAVLQYSLFPYKISLRIILISSKNPSVSKHKKIRNKSTSYIPVSHDIHMDGWKGSQLDQRLSKR